ncbi:MAG: hypothetical protein E7485_09640 [Ruminococcaceae bacterium]|nr:hypothetical protein [Oscillospiraceae bacterium]
MIFIPKRLYSRLKSIYTQRLTVVCAPEGSGKTTILKEFLRRSRPEGASCRFISDCGTANECFSRYCKLLLGTDERIPITRQEFLALKDRLLSVSVKQPYVIVIDSSAAANMLLGSLYCARLLGEYSPVSLVITCDSITFHQAKLIEDLSIDLISKEELQLTSDETARFLKLCEADSSNADEICSRTSGDILRIRLCAIILTNGGSISSYELQDLLPEAMLRVLDKSTVLCALCAAAFFTLDEQTCTWFAGEKALVDCYGADALTLSAIRDGIDRVNKILPLIDINRRTNKYNTPFYIKLSLFRYSAQMPDEIRKAIYRCSAKDCLRAGRNFVAFCQYCSAGEHDKAAVIPSHGILMFEIVLQSKRQIYDIVKNASLENPLMIPRLLRLLSLLALTDYKPYVKKHFDVIIKSITERSDITEEKRRDMLCYAYALRSYEDFYLMEKMGTHIKRAYEYYSGISAFSPPFYSWSLYAPSVFELIHRFSIPLEAEAEQFTRYHHMYTEMIGHGAYIEKLYIAEMYYYTKEFEKGLNLSRDIALLCSSERLVPTKLIALYTAARCSLMLGNYEPFSSLCSEIAELGSKYYSSESGDMALLILAQLSCIKSGTDEERWNTVSKSDELIMLNRFAAPFYYCVRCFSALMHKEYNTLFNRNADYLSIANEVRNETAAARIELITAIAHYKTGREKTAMTLIQKILDKLLLSGLIMPAAEICVHFPAAFKAARYRLSSKYNKLLSEILNTAHSLRKSIELVRIQELSENDLYDSKTAVQTQHKTAAKRSLNEQRLTAKAYDIAKFAAEGASNEVIAETFGISIDSVKSSLKRTYAKLGIKSRGQLKRLFNNN